MTQAWPRRLSAGPEADIFYASSSALFETERRFDDASRQRAFPVKHQCLGFPPRGLDEPGATCCSTLRSRPAAIARALSVGRAGRRRGDRAADLHHARVRGRQLGAFRLAGGQPRHAGLRPRPARSCASARTGSTATGAASRRACAAAVRAADGRGQSAGAADSFQCHLPHFRSRRRSGGWRPISCSTAAVPRRRVFPRHGVPEGRQDLRPRSISPTCPAPDCPASPSWRRCIVLRPTI